MSLYWKRGEVGRVIYFQVGNAAGIYQDMTGGSANLVGRARGTSAVLFTTALVVPASVAYPSADGWLKLTIDSTMAAVDAGDVDLQVDATLSGGAKEKFPNDRHDTGVVTESVSAYP